MIGIDGYGSDLFESDFGLVMEVNDVDYDIMGKLTGVGIQKEYERNGLKTKMVAIQLDYDGEIGLEFLCEEH
ncbi:hypothetical protein P8452_52884 [Trifolium repens]|nr:hypothetical protein P8452_52884 [Trifolium repens]